MQDKPEMNTQAEEKLFQQIHDLLLRFADELDFEYKALQKGDLACLKTSKIRQYEIQHQIDDLQNNLVHCSGHLNFKSELDASKKTYLAPIGKKVQVLFRRNLQACLTKKSEIQLELKQLGNFRRMNRQLFPKKLRQNTPVFLDIRR